LKALIVGHGCNPYTSSEPGLTFNWAYFMADHCTVHLIAHPHTRTETERFLAERPKPNLTIHWVNADSRFDPWDPQRGERGIHFHYLLWLRNVARYSRALNQKEQFDLVHHVGWATVSVPSPLWKLGIPLVWGPLGGGQTSPKGLQSVFGREQWKEAIRTMRVRLLPFSPAFKRAVKRSAVLLATNRETAQLLSSAGAASVISLFDNGLRSESYPESFDRTPEHGRIKLLWVGKLLRWKGLDLALAAMRELGTKAQVQLTIAGDGPYRSEFESTVRRLGLDDVVTFKGRVPWEGMSREFRNADVFLFTSLRDSSGSVVLEAATYGLPFITLDISGIGTFLPASAAIKIKPTTVEGTASEIAAAVRTLQDDPVLREKMGGEARRFAESMRWEIHAETMWTIYRDVARVPRATGVSI
jgi:glycosyltransferase involved in cell wall biosynthesis